MASLAELARFFTRLDPEAIAHRLPITHYKPRSAAAKAAMALAEEVLERMSRSAADRHEQGEAA